MPPNFNTIQINYTIAQGLQRLCFRRGGFRWHLEAFSGVRAFLLPAISQEHKWGGEELAVENNTISGSLNFKPGSSVDRHSWTKLFCEDLHYTRSLCLHSVALGVTKKKQPSLNWALEPISCLILLLMNIEELLQKRSAVYLGRRH